MSYYRAELERVLAEKRAAGQTIEDETAVLPGGADPYLMRVAERAYADCVQEVGQDTREAAARWESGKGRLYVDQVLARHSVEVAEREALDVRRRLLKIRIAMLDRGIMSPPRVSRAERPPAPIDPPGKYSRSWELDDIQILRSADGGDGRTVEAYAAVFGTPVEIKDTHGRYYETIAPTAFNRALRSGIDRVGVFYHHALTMAGTPSDLGSVPIGSPVSIRADSRGLLTVTRFNRTALADSVLEAIRNGDIKGYSFRGQIFRSDPDPMPKTRPGILPRVTRLELGLMEYGPTPTPAYLGAKVLAVRSTRSAPAAEQRVSRELDRLAALVADLRRQLDT